MNVHLKRPLWIAIGAAALPVSGVCQVPGITSPAAPAGNHQVVSRLQGNVLAQLDGSLQQIATKVSPAVVQIQVSGYGPASDGDRLNTALIVRQHSIGAGVIVDPNGYIMTNAHVVEGAQRIRVVLAVPPTTSDDVSNSGNMRVLDATLIGLQKQTDLAVLKVDATDLPTLRLRVDHSPQPGELVLAIGSPEGLQNSVSMGVISSASRQPDPANPMVYLQTDTPINPGNSGGPLIDVTGAVVGINTFIVSRGGGSEGLGFAIPARIVDFVYQSLKKYGHVDRMEIGVIPQMITPTLAEGLGLAQNWGVMIADVAPSGPAGDAGIKPGDIVLSVDHHEVPSLIGFTAALYQHKSDEPLTMDVLRGTRRLSFNVPGILTRDPMDELADAADPKDSHIAPLGILGLDFSDRFLGLLPGVRLRTGVLVIAQAPGFSSVSTGLLQGDVIHSLNRTPIDSVQQLKSAVSQLNPGDPAVLRIERRGQFQYLAFEME